MRTSKPDTIPPHDLDAERATLGALMLGGSLGDVALSAADFYHAGHGQVFAAIARLAAAQQPVDAVSLAAALSSPELEAIGGKGQLLDLTGAVPAAGHASRYGAIVREKARLRRAIAAATATITAAYEAQQPADAVIGDGAAAMLALADTGARSIVSASEAVAQRLKEYASPTEAAMLPGTSTRLHFGDVVIIGGRPGTGKTALALQAADVWRKRWPVLFLSFEMSTAELADRLVSRATGQSSDVVYSGLSEYELDVYRSGCADILADHRLGLVGAAGMSEAQTVASIRAFAARGGRVVILDYVQIAAESRSATENANLTRLMRELQQVAKRSGVLLLALSQYSRPAPGAEEPGIHQLRGSGSLEQEAACVGLMWSPEPKDQESRKRELAERGYLLSATDPSPLVRLHFAKVRHGSQATNYFLLNGAAMRLEPVDQRQ